MVQLYTDHTEPGLVAPRQTGRCELCQQNPSLREKNWGPYEYDISTLSSAAKNCGRLKRAAGPATMNTGGRTIFFDR